MSKNIFRSPNESANGNNLTLGNINVNGICFAGASGVDGDILLLDENGCVEGLSVGANNDILTVRNNFPTYSNEIIQNRVTTNTLVIPNTVAGDLIVFDSNETAARLPIGTSGQLLTTDGNTVFWQDLIIPDPFVTNGLQVLNLADINNLQANTGTINNLTAGSLNLNGVQQGDLLIGNNNSGDISRLPLGNPGEVLTVGAGGFPEYQPVILPDPLVLNGLIVQQNFTSNGNTTINGTNFTINNPFINMRNTDTILLPLTRTGYLLNSGGQLKYTTPLRVPLATPNLFSGNQNLSIGIFSFDPEINYEVVCSFSCAVFSGNPGNVNNTVTYTLTFNGAAQSFCTYGTEISATYSAYLRGVTPNLASSLNLALQTSVNLNAENDVVYRINNLLFTAKALF